MACNLDELDRLVALIEKQQLQITALSAELAQQKSQISASRDNSFAKGEISKDLSRTKP